MRLGGAHSASHRFRRILHEGQVDRTVGTRGRPHAKENNLGFERTAHDLIGKREPRRVQRFLEGGLEPRLKDARSPLSENPNRLFVDVRADDVMSRRAKTTP